ncbi:MAG: hypothetical protein UX60_C0028G0007, partial [Berkelbacteria bacterium GW2011_GWA2_46_7]
HYTIYGELEGGFQSIRFVAKEKGLGACALWPIAALATLYELLLFANSRWWKESVS